MAFDAEVLTTTQEVTKRSSISQAEGEVHSVSKRGFMSMIAKMQKTNLAAIAAAVAAAAAQGKPAPKPNLCNVGSMRLGAVLKSKHQVVIGGKPNVLNDQPYKFGSQCIPFAAPAGPVIPSQPSSTPTVSSSAVRVSTPSASIQSSSAPRSSSAPSASQSSPAASCMAQASGFYPPPDSKCFKVAGHGLPSIEGKYMNLQPQNANPTIGWQNLPPSIFYLDNSGYMYEAFRGGVMGTPYSDGSAWMAFVLPQYLGSTPRATCTKDANTKALKCFQTKTDALTISLDFPSYDSRQASPMWGFADRTFQQISLTYEDTPCPAACSSSTPIPTPSATPALASSSIAPSQSSSPVTSQCSNSLSWTAPAGSTCFQLVGHGPAHIEGQILGMAPGYSGPAFGWDNFKPATYNIDSNGNMYVASETGNGWVMATLPIDGYSPWISFFPPNGNYEGKSYPRATCSLSGSDKSLKCSLAGFNSWIIAPTHNFYSASDTRSGNPIFGVPSGPWVSMTITYNEVACPVKCGASPSPSLSLPSSTPPVWKPSPSAAIPSSSIAPSQATPTPSASPSPAAQGMQPCGGYSPGGNFAISGATYNVYCGVTGSSPVTKLDSVFLPSFKECMASCNTKTGCKAVMFREIAPVDGAYQCTRYSSLGLPQDDGFDWEGTFDIAFKVKGAGGTTP